MAKIDWSFLCEAFALASGVPPQLWRQVPNDAVGDVQPEQNRSPVGATRKAGISPRKFAGKRGAGDTELSVRGLGKVLLTTIEALR